MLCLKCGNERPKEDFYKQNICFKCQYAEKVLMQSELEIKKRCPICKNEVPKGQIIYCSKDCLKQMKTRQNKARYLKSADHIKIYW